MKKQILFITVIIGVNINVKSQNNNIFPDNGNAGIGTLTLLDAKLNIKSGWGNWMSFIDQYNNDVYGFHNPNNGGRMELYIKDGITSNHKFGVFTILKSGNIGIGITTPKSKLDIGTNYSDPSVYPNKITLWSGGQNNYFGFGISSGDLDYFSQGNHRFYTEYNGTPGSEKMVIKSNGNVGIGTINPNGWKLAINGRIRAKEIKVETEWSDFVFENDYKLPTLKEVEIHIKKKGHLKDIPSAKEVEQNGIFLGEMNSKLLQKIEELTLYTIQQQKEIGNIKKENKSLKKMNSKLLELQKRLEKLENK